MAQAKIINVMVRPGCGSVRIDMYPEVAMNSVEITIHSQLFTPTELRTVARLLEQAADRKEELFTVVYAS
jgi:hypothetical protein